MDTNTHMLTQTHMPHTTCQVCHIGRRRLYQPDDEGDIDAKRKEFIDSRSSCTGVASPSSSCQDTPVVSADKLSLSGVALSGSELCGRGGDVSTSGSCGDDTKGCVLGEPWLATFKPRPEERTRNGSRIDPKIKALIVNTVAFKLLSEENYVNVPVTETSHSSEGEPTGSDGRQRWNVGGKHPLFCSILYSCFLLWCLLLCQESCI